MPADRHRVVAIGLDAAEPTLIEHWMRGGHLPRLSELRSSGTYGRVKNFENGAVETAWTTFATGMPPEETGFWNFLGLRGYEYQSVRGYDYEEFPPFYALGPAYQVAAFDVPQVRLTDRLHGLQVAAWGAHSPQVPAGSFPAALYDELVTAHGPHPALHEDYALCLDLPGTLNLESRFQQGITRRSAICRDLLARQAWDLFLTVFSETHSAGHVFWQLSQPDHPLFDAFRHRCDHDPLLETYRHVDRAIGEIVSQVPDDSYLILFSDHGMGAAVHELPSFVFLPEFLFRLSFPGAKALADDTDAADQLSPPLTRMEHNFWRRHVWSTRYDRNSVRRYLRRRLHNRIYEAIEPWLEATTPTNIDSPFQLVRKGDRDLPWIPAKWYQPVWPRMKAFALPSFADGFVRINVVGREPQGIVAAAEYEPFREGLCEKLHGLLNSRTQTPLVKSIIRTRRDPYDSNPKLPDADLIVVWQTDHAADVVHSPDVGRMGPLPFCRAGTHRAEGFVLARGPGITAGGTLPHPHALDLAPTILHLLGAEIPSHMPGQPVLPTRTVV